jgi:hypothetical protein
MPFQFSRRYTHKVAHLWDALRAIIDPPKPLPLNEQLGSEVGLGDDAAADLAAGLKASKVAESLRSMQRFFIVVPFDEELCRHEFRLSVLAVAAAACALALASVHGSGTASGSGAERWLASLSCEDLRGVASLTTLMSWLLHYRYCRCLLERSCKEWRLHLPAGQVHPMRGSWVWDPFLSGLMLYGLHNPPAAGAALDLAFPLGALPTWLSPAAAGSWNGVLDFLPGLLVLLRLAAVVRWTKFHSMP